MNATMFSAIKIQDTDLRNLFHDDYVIHLASLDESQISVKKL